MLLKLSLLLNVFFILAGSFVCYKKRATLKTLVAKYFAKSKVSEMDLKNFNIEPYEIKNDTIQVNKGGGQSEYTVPRKFNYTYRSYCRRAG